MTSVNKTREDMRELAALEDPKVREANEREHRTRAIGIGEQLAVLIGYSAAPGCTPPYAPVWIAEMVRRNEDTRRLRRRETD